MARDGKWFGEEPRAAKAWERHGLGAAAIAALVALAAVSAWGWLG